MTKSNHLKPIQYTVLDRSINFNNYKKEATKLNTSTSDVFTTFKDVPLEKFQVILFFENVPAMKNYQEWLEYVRHLWVNAKFYIKINKELLKYGCEAETDKVCMSLMMLKIIQDKFEKMSQPEDNLNPEQELERFLHDIIQQDPSLTNAKSIEFIKGNKLAEYAHANFIVKKLKVIIDDYYCRNDLTKLFEILLNSKRKSEEKITRNELKIAQAQFRKFCLITLHSIIKPLELKATDKYILCNQLLALSKILDYTLLKNTHGTERNKIIQKIKMQMQYDLTSTMHSSV